MPVVTITGDIGSDGDRIALALSEQLGVRLVDRRALMEATRGVGAAGAPHGGPERAGRAPDRWERLNEQRRRYGVLVRAVAFKFAAADNCVMLGYSGVLLLREVCHVLKVHTIAPRDVRLQRLM